MSLSNPPPNPSGHRFFTDNTYTGVPGIREIAAPPWTEALPAEFRFPYDILEHALPQLQAQNLRFFFTKDAYALPDYGRDVVAVLLQEERCKVPVYGRHVRAVVRNLLSQPYLGWRPHWPLSRLEAVLTFEYARDAYTHLRSRFHRAHPPQAFGSPVRKQPVTIPIPLGYHSQVDLPLIPMGERPLDSFFAGEVGAYFASRYQRYSSTSKIEARGQIWKILHELRQSGNWRIELGDKAGGQRIASDGSRDLEYDSYSQKMMHSRICLAPRGTMAETYRAYEGLRAGCLVLTNPLPNDGFLLPDAPILIVDHWRELPALLEKFARNLPVLDEFQARGLAWWHTHLRPEVLAVAVAEKLNHAGATLLG